MYDKKEIVRLSKEALQEAMAFASLEKLATSKSFVGHVEHTICKVAFNKDYEITKSELGEMVEMFFEK